ncbi:hypothetical protein Bca4012_065475 [Brassica carinata]
MNSFRCFYTRANSLLFLRSSFSPVTIPARLRFRRLSSVFDSLSNQTVNSISDVDTKTHFPKRPHSTINEGLKGGKGLREWSTT